MKQAVVLYLHVHQPFRIKHYTVFDVGNNHNYFDDHYDNSRLNNEKMIRKVAEKSYIPTNQYLLELLNKYPEFKLSLSMSGVVIEQLEKWAPDALDLFKQLCDTGRVEIVGETYHHTLAFFYSKPEFEIQVDMHKAKIQEVFNQLPTVFRNTELAYNNDLALWAEQAGYKGILAEGWDKVLGWRNSNFVYQPVNTNNIRLLLKNYHLSDDIAFRFDDHDWSEWPMTAEKFVHWLDVSGEATNFNLFMDYETFGEHQWEHSGIFEFLKDLPGKWLKNPDHTFMTVSEAIDNFEVKDKVDVPETLTWADTERDLSAWLGNNMQQQSINALYGLEEEILQTGDLALIEDWRKLQTSDHFYYMCTKWFNDGDIHAYFSPYESPYEAVINYMNAWHDIKSRLLQTGIEP
jgi:alpha-amylase